MTLAELNARALEARIANASLPAGQIKGRQALIETCAQLVNSASWALDPEEGDPAYWARSVVEQAHELLDLAHAFKHEVTRGG